MIVDDDDVCVWLTLTWKVGLLELELKLEISLFISDLLLLSDIWPKLHVYLFFHHNYLGMT